MRSVMVAVLSVLCGGVAVAADFEGKKGFEVSKLTYDPVKNYRVYAPEYLLRNTELVMRTLEREAKDPMRLRDAQTDRFMDVIRDAKASETDRQNAMLEIMSRRFPRVEVKDGETTYIKLLVPPSAIARLAGKDGGEDLGIARNLLLTNVVTDRNVNGSLSAVVEEANQALKRNPNSEEVSALVRNVAETAEAIAMREGNRRDREPQWAEAKKEIDALLEVLKNAVPVVSKLQGLQGGAAKPKPEGDHSSELVAIRPRARPADAAKDPAAADFRAQLNRAIAAARLSGDKEAIEEVEALAALLSPSNASRFEVVKGGFARLNAIRNTAFAEAKTEATKQGLQGDNLAKRIEELAQAKMVDKLGQIFFREEWSKIPAAERKNEVCKKLRGCPVFRSQRQELGCAA